MINIRYYSILGLGLVLPLFGNCANDEKIPVSKDKPQYNTIDLKSYELIFADEFDGKKMDWNLWAADNPNNIKHETSRGPEAVEVKDGELRLNVKKVNRGKVQWLAGYVYLQKPLENNVYVECRFKSGAATGVNNAFWLACKTPPNNTYQNKYEVDIVEARKDNRDGKGKAHLAWHDWKTYPYAKDKSGKNADIAQGISVEHDFDEYHVWGVWYGENEMIYFLDGMEMWRGKTHPTYTDQWYTGVGKAPVWNPQEQIRAYGNYGQNDWSYMGGYNGDLMHVILSNIPWGESWTPLVEAEADGSYMAVDYVRIYKPKSMLTVTPDINVKVASSDVVLSKPYSLAKDNNIYFSAEVTRRDGEEVELIFQDAKGATVAKVIVDANGYILTGITKLASNEFASSVVKGLKLVPENKPVLIVCRITAKEVKGKYDKDAISVWCVSGSSAKDAKEPYFYPNVDENGNTSQSQQWHISQKGFSDDEIYKVKLSSTLGDLSSFGRFRAGSNFVSVTK